MVTREVVVAQLARQRVRLGRAMQDGRAPGATQQSSARLSWLNTILTDPTVQGEVRAVTIT